MSRRWRSISQRSRGQPGLPSWTEAWSGQQVLGLGLFPRLSLLVPGTLPFSGPVAQKPVGVREMWPVWPQFPFSLRNSRGMLGVAVQPWLESPVLAHVCGIYSWGSLANPCTWTYLFPTVQFSFPPLSSPLSLSKHLSKAHHCREYKKGLKTQPQ